MRRRNDGAGQRRPETAYQGVAWRVRAAAGRMLAKLMRSRGGSRSTTPTSMAAVAARERRECSTQAAVVSMCCRRVGRADAAARLAAFAHFPLHAHASAPHIERGSRGRCRLLCSSTCRIALHDGDAAEMCAPSSGRYWVLGGSGSKIRSVVFMALGK